MSCSHGTYKVITAKSLISSSTTALSFQDCSKYIRSLQQNPPSPQCGRAVPHAVIDLGGFCGYWDMGVFFSSSTRTYTLVEMYTLPSISEGELPFLGWIPVAGEPVHRSHKMQEQSRSFFYYYLLIAYDRLLRVNECIVRGKTWGG
jgi:hypothetical protein